MPSDKSRFVRSLRRLGLPAGEILQARAAGKEDDKPPDQEIGRQTALAAYRIGRDPFLVGLVPVQQRRAIEDLLQEIDGAVTLIVTKNSLEQYVSRLRAILRSPAEEFAAQGSADFKKKAKKAFIARQRGNLVFKLDIDKGRVTRGRARRGS